MGAASDLRPVAKVTVVGGLGDEYYVPESADGAIPCEFHVGQSAASQPKYIVPTITYHEAVPGRWNRYADREPHDRPANEFRRAVAHVVPDLG